MFLDFDGTIAPIAGRPEMASLPAETRELLRLLSSIARCDVCVISGRALKDVKSLVGLKDLYYAGNHGLEIEGPGFKFIHPVVEKISSVIGEISKSLESILSGVEGVLVEDKGFTVSVHYRLVPEEKIASIERLVWSEVGRRRHVMVTRGKKVLEVRPAVDWNKGKAAELILKSVAPRSLSIYVGDDETDEDAFRQLKAGLTIAVMKEPAQTHAKYYLKDTVEVQCVLRKIIGLMLS